MKNTGIVRRIDELGRIVVPMELRRTLDIKSRDLVEILVDDDGIIAFKKFTSGCVFCNSTDSTKEFKGKTVCDKCMAKLAE